MDIKSKSGWPASSLSNFSPHPFILDGVLCSSMEGFLQSLKFDKAHIQVGVCLLVGKDARTKGQERNDAWKSVQTLWWQGRVFERRGYEYQVLLDKAFDALALNRDFQDALLETDNAVLTHSIGSSEKSETILTESEFCARLMSIRSRLQKQLK